MGKTVMVCHNLLNYIYRDISGPGIIKNVLELLFGNFQGNPFVQKIRISNQFCKSCFEVPDVCGNPVTNKGNDIIGYTNPLFLLFFFSE